jgi:hypothetical protein
MLGVFLPNGILLSQFLQETEKKKRKSCISDKSCQIAEDLFIIKVVMRLI